MPLIIDSHLDLAWNALSWNRDQTWTIAQIRAHEAAMTDERARGRCTVCLPELRHAGVAVCLATVLARAKQDVRPPLGHRRADLDFATQDLAYAIGQGQLAYYQLLASRGQVRMIGTQSQLQSHWDDWQQQRHRPDLPIGFVLAMEGADPIADPAQARQWWDQGLRVVGLAHYGRGHYAMGTGESGPLTPRGLDLLREFARLGMIVDLTHCCDQSFFHALDAFPGPVLASHNNCRAFVPGQRQFSDEQIKLLAQRGAVIGVALDSWMLKPDYIKGQTPRDQVPLSTVADHLDHLCQVTGSVQHAALGSDLDGGFGTEQSPHEIDTIADLQKLEPILQSRGYASSDLDAIFHRNWLEFFLRHLPAN